jgi:hypothetical protein
MIIIITSITAIPPLQIAMPFWVSVLRPMLLLLSAAVVAAGFSNWSFSSVGEYCCELLLLLLLLNA